MNKILSFLMVLATAPMAAAGPQLFSQSAQRGFEFVAEVEPSPMIVDPNSHFSQTSAWYDQGRDVKWAEMKGFWVGRCFVFDNPEPTNSFLGYYAKDNGPGVPPSIYVDSAYYMFRPANAYDRIGDYTKQISETSKLFKKDLVDTGKGAPIVEEPTVTAFTDFEPNSAMDLKSEFRVHGDKLVRRVTNLITQKLLLGNMLERRTIAAGEAVFSCYYFKKVSE